MGKHTKRSHVDFVVDDLVAIALVGAIDSDQAFFIDRRGGRGQHAEELHLSWSSHHLVGVQGLVGCKLRCSYCSRSHCRCNWEGEVAILCGSSMRICMCGV